MNSDRKLEVIHVGKTDSETISQELVLPNDTNNIGNLCGGRLMHWIDLTAAVCAQRYCRKTVVTRAVDNLEFRHPIRLGETVVLKAKVIKVGRTSMDVSVDAYAENMLSGDMILANTARLTFVAVDSDGNPIPVNNEDNE